MTKEKIQIGAQEIVPGSWYETEALSPISEPISVGGKVEAIRGGGFYGKVLLLEDEVIKTTEPDPWHQLWRHINWGLSPFPPQSNELAAQLDFLAGRIIHQVIPAATDAAATDIKVITPDSIGYNDMDRIGFGQVIERMRGRGVRLNQGLEENEVFSQTRHLIWEAGVTLGLEQTAQVHPDNPFGKPNLWIDEDGQMIWLDVLPAIKHTGWVWPAFNFKFHKDVRQRIGGGEETFNRINTERIMQFAESRPGLMTSSEVDELVENLSVYDEILSSYVDEIDKDNKRESVIKDAVRRRIISPDKATVLMDSDGAYARFLAGTVVKPALGAFSEFIENTSLYRAFSDPEFQADSLRFLRDPIFRRQKFIENTILKGARSAYHMGLIDEEEWLGALEVVSQPNMSNSEAKKLASTYIALQSWFTISGQIINSISIPTIASSVVAENPGARLALGLFIDVVVPPVVRVVSTLLTSWMTKQELNTAMKVSALPKLGGYLAIPADMARRYGDRSEMIWHYAKRGLIASLSKVMRPWGGWNSDLEVSLWEKLKVEDW